MAEKTIWDIYLIYHIYSTWACTKKRRTKITVCTKSEQRCAGNIESMDYL